MGKRQQARTTGQRPPVAMRRLLTEYQRQLNRQKARIATLEDQIKKQELRVALIQEIRRASVSTSNLGSLLPLLLDFILQALDADYGAVLQIDPDQERVFFGVIRARDRSAVALRGVSLKTGYRKGVLTAGDTPVLRTLGSSPPGWVIPRFRGGRGSLLVVPLQVSGRVVGLLELFRFPSSPPFSRHDSEVVTPVGHQLGMALENARLSEQAGKRVGQFSTLMELSTVLNSTLQITEVLRRAVEAATRLMECEVGSLLLLNEESDELVFEVALGERGRELKEIRLKVGEGIAGWVAKTGEPALVNDVGGDSRFSRRVDARTHFHTRNMICTPVKSRERIIGVLQAINRLADQPFTEEDQRMFESLARQVGIAIENARLYAEVKATFVSTAAALAEAIEKRDPYTGGHVRRVVEICQTVGEKLGLSFEEKEALQLAAILHDVGKIGIRDGILQKDGPLTPEELEHIREHPQLGAEILSHVRQLEAVIPAVRHHQERYDGLGYPDGVKGEEIPLASRIVAVSDAFDAMTTDRPYRSRLSDEAAIKEIQRCAGTQFDPKVVQAFMDAFREGLIHSEAVPGPEHGPEERRGVIPLLVVSGGNR
ncbi:MAG: HD domain-containing phosphohydrolase [Candidatus Methylomirabilales bacterium]